MNPEIHRILVIEPHPILREGIVAVLLSNMRDTEVRGADTFSNAVTHIQVHSVDLVITDFHVEDDTALSFLRKHKTARHKPRCLILSDCNDLLIACACIRAGASGVVKKSSPIPVLVEAIRLVLAGNHYLSEQLSRALMARDGPDAASSPATRLTSSELRVFSMIGQGMTVSTIAEKLGNSVKTVEAHREHIKNKLGCQSAAAVAAAAVRWFDCLSIGI